MSQIERKKETPTRNIALELLRATESAALAASKWIGSGNKEAGDKAAVEAMRNIFQSIDINGTVVIGEGEKDQAPMLYINERLGTLTGPAFDIAVDPVEGTNLLATGRPNSISVIALSPSGTMMRAGPSFYMKKIVVPKPAADYVDIDAPVRYNLERVAKALNKKVSDLTVFVLDKPRHQDLIKEIREVGARVQLHSDGDIVGALLAAFPQTDVDILLGTGGTPEGIISAAAIKVLGARILGKFDPQKEDEKRRLIEEGYDMNKVYTEDDMIKSDDVYFVATGITNGSLLKGVKIIEHTAITHSIVMRGHTGTIRYIESHHDLERLNQISMINY
ncbi:MAG: class II fructose-bisphosphatase [Leptospiraceae bacterium]|nr:class II fructose-bisphosphatase [Leptospiraceae bacterium]MDW7976587.1 class II fructose-bisphosphatase [Leptospiraceae bacterium]